MLQLRTTINNNYVYLDLYKNEPVLLSLSFAELQDLTKKNSNFSKAFSLPGSKNNNNTFNFFYDLNSIPTTFNPNDKFNCELLWDGYEIMSGYIRLNSVSITNGEIIYSVTFYNQIGNLMANIGDKFLYDLNLSGLSHPYSQEVILQSNLNPNLFPLTGTTNYSYQNGKTMWSLFNIGYEYLPNNELNTEETPLLQFTPVIGGSDYAPSLGNFDFSGTPVGDYYYKPTIQIKELYEQIVNQSGYNVQSEFFNTSYFKNFYLPLKFGDETIYSNNSIPACYSVNNSGLDLEFGSVFPVNQSTGVTCNSLGWNVNTSYPYDVIIPSGNTGLYKYRFTFSVVAPVSPFLAPLCGTSGANLRFFYTDQVTPTLIYSNLFCESGTTTTIVLEQDFYITGNSNISFYFTLFSDLQVVDYKQEIIDSPRFIPDGKIIDYSIEFPTNDYKQIDFITSINRYFNFVIIPNPDNPSNLIIEPIIDYIGKGEVLDWTTKVDFSKSQQLTPTTSLINGTLEFDFKLDQDYTNQDFNSQANRIFGTDKILLNQQYKDTTTKFDYIFSSPIDITINNAYTPLITIPSMSKVKEVDVSGTTQQTFVPFKILPKLLYRGATIPNDNYGYFGSTAFTTNNDCKTTITINIITPGYISYYTCPGEQIVQFYGTTGTTILTNANCISLSSVRGILTPFNARFTILSSTGGGCIPQNEFANYQYYYMNNIQMDRWTNINRFTTYPFNYNNFSHYTNFRGEDKTNVKPGEFSFVADDLYNVYYEDYVKDILSPENKIYSCKIYLYPQDIQNLRWNERILINNTYFRINKISNFNALEPSICDIELVKLTKTYQSHPIIYYEFSSCVDENEKYYSNSDLMYHAYAYAGNKVRLFDDGLNYLGCFSVSIITFNPLHDYQHYYFDGAYPSNLVGVYSDCNCSVRTQFILVQEEPVIPLFFNYLGFDCNDPDVSYNFSSTASTLNPSGVYRIFNSGTSETICVNNITSNFLQQVSWVQIGSFNNCEECLLVPTPTPLPTPTPTPTECICNEYGITNLSENIEVVACWTDCNSGNQVCNIILPQTSILICACAGSVTTAGGNAEITSIRPCCVCNEYSITNFSQDASATACWTTCSGDQICNVILPGQFITICACANSISITQGNANINLDGSC